MDAYIYNADLYCEECADEIKSRILADVTARLEGKIETAIACLEQDLGIELSDKTQERIRDLTIKAALPDPDSCDSGEYPCGPYGDGGGESDTPAHCGACGEFLENPLTSDGMAYVRTNPRPEWDSFYGVTREEPGEYSDDTQARLDALRTDNPAVYDQLVSLQPFQFTESAMVEQLDLIYGEHARTTS